MKRVIQSILSWGLAGFLAISPAVVIAAQDPGFPETGRIDSVDLRNGLVVIDDIQYRLTSNTLVYTATGGLGTQAALKKGINVRIRLVNPQGPGKPVLLTLHILPAR